MVTFWPPPHVHCENTFFTNASCRRCLVSAAVYIVSPCCLLRASTWAPLVPVRVGKRVRSVPPPPRPDARSSRPRPVRQLFRVVRSRRRRQETPMATRRHRRRHATPCVRPRPPGSPLPVMTGYGALGQYETRARDRPVALALGSVRTRVVGWHKWIVYIYWSFQDCSELVLRNWNRLWTEIDRITSWTFHAYLPESVE